MQFNIPQYIDVESPIIGPLTVKQFLYLLGGVAIIFFSWYFFKFWLFIIIAIPVAALFLALVFLKINGRPFGQILAAFIGFSTKPKLYVWKREK